MKKILTALAALSGMLVVLVSSSIATGANPRASLAGSVPSWATSANFKSAAAPSSAVNFRVYLGLRKSAEAEALARAVATPGSSQYGKFLTPGQFQSQFAPSQADVASVKSWLQSQGLSVAYVPSNNHFVAAEGTAAQVSAAFNTQLNLYSVDGKTLRAPSSALSVPASLAGVVAGVLGVDQGLQLLQPQTKPIESAAPPSNGFRNAQPLSLWWNEKNTATTPTNEGVFLPKYRDAYRPWATRGYSPDQLRGAYGVNTVDPNKTGGTGVTVAVVDAYASPTIVQDVNEYARRHGLPQLSSSNFMQIAPPGTYNRPETPAQDPQGWYGEETLDVEAVHSMAPGAKIVYFGSPNNYRDLDALLNHVVDRRIADIVTNSYGYGGEALPPGYIKPLNETFLQGVLQGMSFLFSSGDSGDETGGVAGARPTPDWPASSPYVTAVGGTSLKVGPADDYQGESYWGTMRNRINCSGFVNTAPGATNAWCPNEVYLYGGGGGTSRLFSEPLYQRGFADRYALKNGNGFAGRVVPDISAVGDPNTGMLVGQTQQFPDGTYYDEYRIGGTSLSSPLMAGMVAVAQQLRGGRPFGFLNPILYSLGPGAYHDIVSPSNLDTPMPVRADYVNGVDATNGYLYSVRRSNVLFTLESVPGYDDSTGLGTPNGAAFFTALASK